MDVGCANGLLLESVIGWAAERGYTIRPHGIDFIAELIDCARARHPGHRDSFAAANAFYWRPKRRYDFVRMNLEYVPEADWPGFVNRLYSEAVAPGGRLIVCHYRSDRERVIDVPAVVEALGLPVAGRSGAPGVSMAWVDRPATDAET
jgi:2-polyprenyl-3-methyl-5-hydroxy-6-metoxy-1,4-benzoquinol methylase